MDFHLDGVHITSTRLTRSDTDHDGRKLGYKNGTLYLFNENAGAKDMADTFIREVVKLHGLPTEIISDMDAKFSGEFRESLCNSLGIR